MPAQSTEICKISWHDALPALRLTTTFWRAFSFGPLAAGFAAMFLTYALGRTLDPLWVKMGAGVPANKDASVALAPNLRQDEIRAFASLDSAGFEAWKAIHGHGRVTENPPAPDASRIKTNLELIDARLVKGASRISNDAQLSSNEKGRLIAELRRAGDVLRFQLLAVDRNPYPAITTALALEKVLGADTGVTVRQRTDEERSLTESLELSGRQIQRARLADRGPFSSLLDYEMHCVASAVQGVAHGRWGLQANAFDRDPALLGSVVSAAKGFVWLLSQRPVYAAVFGVLVLLLTAPFAGVICRLAAIKTARDEIGEFGKAFSFMRERYAALISAPLMCIGFIAAVTVLLGIGGVFGAIPKVGPLLMGLTFFLAILGGLALAFAGVLFVCGFPLMWPTIAIEGSDAFDALQRGGSYTFQRPGLAALYFSLLLICGSLALLAARCVVMFALKATHAAVGMGMNLFDGSDRTDSIGRLEAIWWMPAWQDLSLLPNPGQAPLWGVIGFAPLSTSESIGAFLCAFWVFLMVGMLGAFFIAYLWTGMTDIYFLLRGSVDGVDETEIYYETEPDLYASATMEATEAGATSPRPGVALPVMSAPASPSR